VWAIDYFAATGWPREVTQGPCRRIVALSRQACSDTSWTQPTGRPRQM